MVSSAAEAVLTVASDTVRAVFTFHDTATTPVSACIDVTSIQDEQL